MIVSLFCVDATGLVQRDGLKENKSLFTVPCVFPILIVMTVN